MRDDDDERRESLHTQQRMVVLGFRNLELAQCCRSGVGNGACVRLCRRSLAREKKVLYQYQVAGCERAQRQQQSSYHGSKKKERTTTRKTNKQTNKQKSKQKTKRDERTFPPSSPWSSLPPLSRNGPLVTASCVRIACSFICLPSLTSSLISQLSLSLTPLSLSSFSHGSCCCYATSRSCCCC